MPTKDERERAQRANAKLVKEIGSITRSELRALDDIIFVNGWFEAAKALGIEPVKISVGIKYPGSFGRKIIARLHMRLNGSVDTMNDDGTDAESDTSNQNTFDDDDTADDV